MPVSSSQRNICSVAEPQLCLAAREHPASSGGGDECGTWAAGRALTGLAANRRMNLMETQFDINDAS